MEALSTLLLVFILICAVAVSLTKDLLTSIIIFMAQSTAMSVVWILLRSPDLAITEAAVGAGVTTLLMFVALKKLHAIKTREDEHDGRK
ncbi:MAG: hydrogenase subunit MbhD domain-containing protein [Eubacteriales bacterium]|nr:hydrogenase subunit MbhD domain-containing protein [Eubacteriales bacterium]